MLQQPSHHSSNLAKESLPRAQTENQKHSIPTGAAILEHAATHHRGIAQYGQDYLSTFATVHAQILDRFDRAHQVVALHSITKDNIGTFLRVDGQAFSKFKYGDPESISYFAHHIADQLWKEHAPELMRDPHQFCILAPAYRKNPTAAVILAEQVAEVLRTKYHIPIEQYGMSRRQLAVGDYGVLKTREERGAFICNNFYYDGPSLSEKTVFFVEDALVSGTHYQETQRVLIEEHEFTPDRIKGYFIVEVKAETFGEEQYSVENLLNHLWIDRGRVDRLVEILEKPETLLTPRVLKMLLTEPWLQVETALSKLNVQTILSIHHAVDLEQLSAKPIYSESAERLRDYATQRLQQWKSELGITASISLHDQNAEVILREPSIPHPWFERKLTVAEAYSLLKFGNVEAIEHFAQQLASLVHEELGEQFGMAGQEAWAIAAPGYSHAPGAAKMLASRVAEILALPLTEVNRTDVPEKSYGALGDARARQREVTSGKYEVKGATAKNLILIEDAVVSGANTDRLKKVLEGEGRVVVPFALVDIATPDLTLEEALNSASISAASPQVLFDILQDPRSTIVMRTLKTLFRADEAAIRKLTESLALPRAVEIFNLTRQNGLDQKCDFSAGFAAFSRALNARIRIEKGGELPAYEPLVILDDSNARAIMSTFGPHYSALKYGDPSAIEQAVHDMAGALRTRFGDAIDSDPQGWVVAGTHYHRVDNAASAIARKVAHELGVSFADLRRHRIYEGEFGALEKREERDAAIGGNAYCTNPDTVRGKKVLYCDDAIVSGAHLMEHVRALNAAGASEVYPFALLDIASQKLSLEKALNYSHIRAGDAKGVLRILEDPKAPLLTRTLKLFLKLDRVSFDQAAEKLSNARLYEMLDGAQMEGYGALASMSANVTRLETVALRRHVAAMPHEDQLTHRNYRIMLFDYDETLATTLTPLSEEIMHELSFFLKKGVHIGIQTLQPIAERGLGEYTLTPLRNFIEAQGKGKELFSRLHLIPNEGVTAYRVDENGLVKRHPEYHLGFRDDHWENLQRIVLDGKAGELSTKQFIRGGYISLHFAKHVDLETAKSVLDEALTNFPTGVTVSEKRAAEHNKHVLHIKSSAASKALGRDYMIKTVGAEIERQSGVPLERGEILVIGDRMGSSPSERDDAAMFVYGGVNIALGKEAMPGAYSHYCRQGPRGTLQLLGRIRKAWTETTSAPL